jgi:tRNA A37 threonylcarbamoyladenosine synthetase subunit TsaC/SUA5/YrdC
VKVYNPGLAIDAIENGGLALIKAHIGYGLLGNSESSIKKMYNIKGRPYSNPCIIPANLELASQIAEISKTTMSWLEEITQKTTLAVVFKIKEDAVFLKGLDPWVREQATVNNTVALFLNTGDYIEDMVEIAMKKNMLLIGSSGNLSGHGNQYEVESVGDEIVNQADFFYDGGECIYKNDKRMATTIINNSNKTVRRRGVNSESIISSYERYHGIKLGSSEFFKESL